jgi:hypothetical protein
LMFHRRVSGAISHLRATSGWSGACRRGRLHRDVPTLKAQRLWRLWKLVNPKRKIQKNCSYSMVNYETLGYNMYNILYIYIYMYIRDHRMIWGCNLPEPDG